MTSRSRRRRATPYHGFPVECFTKDSISFCSYRILCFILEQNICVFKHNLGAPLMSKKADSSFANSVTMCLVVVELYVIVDVCMACLSVLGASF